MRPFLKFRYALFFLIDQVLRGEIALTKVLKPGLLRIGGDKGFVKIKKCDVNWISHSHTDFFEILLSILTNNYDDRVSLLGDIIW